MKANFEIEVPEETRQFFIKLGAKEEDFNPFIKQTLEMLLNTILEKIPETFLAMKQGLIETPEGLRPFVFGGVKPTFPPFKKE